MALVLVAARLPPQFNGKQGGAVVVDVHCKLRCPRNGTADEMHRPGRAASQF